MPLLESLLLSLGLTLLFELVFAFLLGIRKGKDFLLVALVNVVTNPPLVLTLNLLQRRSMVCFPVILGLELAAIAIEWLLYRKRLEYAKLPPLVFSLLLNAISYTGGLFL